MPTLPFSFTCPAAFSPRPGALVDRFRSSNHIDAIGLVGWAKRSVPTIVVSAWARSEERAFAHPTGWFHGIDPLGTTSLLLKGRRRPRPHRGPANGVLKVKLHWSPASSRVRPSF